jgi:hypothetical protein
MKLKTLVFLAVMSITLSSCFKTRNCKCTTITTAESGEYGQPAGTSTQNYALGGDPFEGGKKSQESQCHAKESSDIYSTTTCDLTK